MKVLFINNTYKRIGGAEVYIYELMKKLEENHHETFFFAIDYEDSIFDDRVCVYQDIYKRSIKKYVLYYYFNPFLYFKLRDFIKKVKPDIIHINNNGAFTSSILFLLKFLSVPIIQTVHDHSLVCPGKYFSRPTGKQCLNSYGLNCVKEGCIPPTQYAYTLIPKIINNILMSKIALFIAPSKILQSRLMSNGFSNVIYLPNFVDANKFGHNDVADNQSNRGINNNILFVGQISEEKGICYLLMAIKELLSQGTQCHLDIVGDGLEKKKLQKLSLDLGIDAYVTFHGRLLGDELRALYKTSDVLVIPSICTENSPLVAYEAMAAGKPIIGSNIGGIPDLVIDGETGFLVEPRNPHQIADRIIRLISDKKLMIRMGVRAREICVSKYDINIYYEHLMIIYNDLLEGNDPLLSINSSAI